MEIFWDLEESPVLRDFRKEEGLVLGGLPVYHGINDY